MPLIFADSGPKHLPEGENIFFGAFLDPCGGRSYLISEGYSTEVEIITQAEAWLLLGRAAHTALPIP
jgi:hypothetical protein